jgi:hypothetical protein
MTKRVVAIHSILVVLIMLLAVFVPSCGGGGAVSMATLAAHFMTPEGEPYPFDRVIVSNGTWRKEFTNPTNATSIETEVPTEFTVTWIYKIGMAVGTFSFTMSFSPGEVRDFNFYLLDWGNCQMRTRPYILLEEKDANATLAWAYNNLTNTLSWNLTMAQGKFVLPGVAFNRYDESNWALAQSDSTSTCTTQKAGPYCVWYTLCFQNIYIDVDTDNWPQHCLIYSVQSNVTRNMTYTYESVSEDLGMLRVQNVFFNDVSLKEIGDDTELRSWNGTLGTPIARMFLDPQYYVPSGNYLLSILNIPAGYFVPKLPIKVLAANDPSYRSINVMSTALKTVGLQPWTFLEVAKRSQFIENSFSNVTNNQTDKTLAVNVTTNTQNDWWGCFVLPNTATVTAAQAYNGTVWHNLTELYDYTINPVYNYSLACVRITPETARLALNYTVAPPA